MRSGTVLSLLALWIPLAAPCQESAETSQAALREALVKVQADIQRDTGVLNELRARVEAERVPLAGELDDLRSRVAELRREVDRVRELRTRGEREQAALEVEAAALEEESGFLRSQFVEYARAMETRMGTARDPARIADLAAAREALGRSGAGLAEAAGALLDLAVEWNAERIGGMRFPGPALDDAGIEHAGRFATFGPAGYFVSDDPSGPVGPVVLRFGDDQPGVYGDLPGDLRENLRGVVSGETADVPVDATGGDAIRVEEARPNLLEHLKQGGFTMIPLAAVALAAVALSLWKLVELSRMRVRADDQVRGVVEALRRAEVEQARAHAAGIRRPLRLLVDDLIAYRDAPREHLEEIMGEHVLASMPYVERNLGALAVLGGVAPLLGLLGTVTGMIHTFQLVTLFGSGDAKLLSGGISEALVTTETGLAIAIPTLLVHAYLSRRARGILGSLETMSATLVNELKLRGREG